MSEITDVTSTITAISGLGGSSKRRAKSSLVCIAPIWVCAEHDDALVGQQSGTQGSKTMRSVINLMLIMFLTISAGALRGNLLLGTTVNQQNEDQNASPQQQEPPTSQGRASGGAMVQSITGCVVQSDHGYSLKTENDTYPIETEKDLSHYVNKQVRVTGVLEHHNATSPSSTTGNATTITDLRLRMIATVIGDCNQSQK